LYDKAGILKWINREEEAITPEDEDIEWPEPLPYPALARHRSSPGTFSDEMAPRTHAVGVFWDEIQQRRESRRGPQRANPWSEWWHSRGLEAPASLRRPRSRPTGTSQHTDEDLEPLTGGTRDLIRNTYHWRPRRT
jgi:hypothetical protein